MPEARTRSVPGDLLGAVDDGLGQAVTGLDQTNSNLVIRALIAASGH
jgi:hypothetical protein